MHTPVSGFTQRGGGAGMPTLTAKFGELAKSYIPKCHILLVCPNC